MANTLAELKRNRESLQEKLLKQSKETKTYEEDTRYWKPTVDKAGNGYAVIRFLPPAKGEEIAWVQYWDHFFKGPTGQWYVENSLTTIGEDDPCSKYNSQLWERGDDEGKNIARKQKRRLHYVSNILVVKDPANPENEGKVFLYEYGKKIFEKINNAMNPEVSEFEDANEVDRVVPFDFWDGCNFKMKIKTIDVDGNSFRNYDDSVFDVAKKGPISEDNKEIEKIWESQYSLNELVDPSKFKTYGELEARLHKVLGINAAVSASIPETVPEEVPEKVAEAPKEKEDKAVDESMEFFESLADDD